MSEFGGALKRLRAELGMAQSDLAGAIGSTQRHVSFLETGRSRATPEMVRRLATELSLSAGQRAALFEASGLRNPYKARDFGSSEIAAALDMIEHRLLANWPFPAFVLDEAWTVLRANAPAETMLSVLGGGESERNLFRIFLSEEFIGKITNWETAGAAIYFRLLAGAAKSAELGEIFETARRMGRFDGVAANLGRDEIPIFVPVELELPGGARLRLTSLLGQLATVHDALVEGFEIEMMVPMDAESEALLRRTFRA